MIRRPERVLPARIERDKHGYYVLLDRPVWFNRTAGDTLDIADHRGTGIMLRLEDDVSTTLELPTLGGERLLLTKVDC